MVFFITAPDHVTDMVEVIALSVVVAVILLGIMFAVPRYVADGSDGWPDILAGLDGVAESWVEKPRIWDIALGVLTIVLLAAGVAIYQDPGMLGDLADSMEFVAHALGILGFVGLYATGYLSVRRTGSTRAEATLIGSSLVGVVLILLISAMLLS